MSKNIDRNKVDLTHLDADELDELETQKFERFQPKKQKPTKGYQGKKKNDQIESD